MARPVRARRQLRRSPTHHRAVLGQRLGRGPGDLAARRRSGDACSRRPAPIAATSRRAVGERPPGSMSPPGDRGACSRAAAAPAAASSCAAARALTTRTSSGIARLTTIDGAQLAQVARGVAAWAASARSSISDLQVGDPLPHVVEGGLAHGPGGDQLVRRGDVAAPGGPRSPGAAPTRRQVAAASATRRMADRISAVAGGSRARSSTEPRARSPLTLACRARGTASSPAEHEAPLAGLLVARGTPGGRGSAGSPAVRRSATSARLSLDLAQRHGHDDRGAGHDQDPAPRGARSGEDAAARRRTVDGTAPEGPENAPTGSNA